MMVVSCVGKADACLRFGVRFLGLVLILVGYFGPWVPHRTAALAVTGLELAEFAKFFPQVQGGVVSITRELFYLPLVVAFILSILMRLNIMKVRKETQ